METKLVRVKRLGERTVTLEQTIYVRVPANWSDDEICIEVADLAYDFDEWIVSGIQEEGVLDEETQILPTEPTSEEVVVLKKKK